MMPASSRESPEPPPSSRTQMPPKPSAAALRRVSIGKISSSSHWRANGIISARANSRAVAWKAACSCVRSKSTGSAEQPGGRIGDRLVLVERKHALDAADQRPDEPPQQDEEADKDKDQQITDNDVQQANPEGADLKPVVRRQ